MIVFVRRAQILPRQAVDHASYAIQAIDPSTSGLNDVGSTTWVLRHGQRWIPALTE